MTATLKKYTLEGDAVGEITINPALATAEAHSQLIKDYITALRYNARQWSACTKTRSEVKHTTKKPHPQKGQGRSRQGSTVAPQYRGGGRAHGPKPKFDVHLKMNAKEKRAAIRALLADKIQSGQVRVLASTQIDAPKTKIVSGFMDSCELFGRTLFLGEGAYIEIGFPGMSQKVSIPTDIHDNFKRSVRNIPHADFKFVRSMSGYDVMVAHDIVITEAALQELQEWLLGE